MIKYVIRTSKIGDLVIETYFLICENKRELKSLSIRDKWASEIILVKKRKGGLRVVKDRTGKLL